MKILLNRAASYAGEHCLAISVYIGIAALVGLNVTRLTNLFVVDETINATWIRYPFSDMFQVIINDNHPPLFFLLQRLWSTVFGVTELSIHILSLLFAAACIVVAHFLFRRLFSERIIVIVGTLLFSVSPLFIAHAILGRWYSFFYFLSLIYCFLVIRFIQLRNRRDLIWISLVGILGLYTNYLMIPLIAASFIYLLYLVVVHHIPLTSLRAICISVGTIFVAFAPWLTIFFYQLYFKEAARLETLPGTNLAWFLQAGYILVLNILGSTIFIGRFGYIALGLGIYMLIYCLSFRNIFRDKAGRVTAGYFLVIAATLFIFLITRKLITPHYALVLNFCFIVLSLYAWKSLRYTYGIALMTAILLFWILPLNNFIHNQEFQVANASDDWKDAMSFLYAHTNCLPLITPSSFTPEYYLKKDGRPYVLYPGTKTEMARALLEPCVILVRTYNGGNQEENKAFLYLQDILRSKKELETTQRFSYDRFWEKKNAILRKQEYFMPYRIEIYMYSNSPS